MSGRIIPAPWERSGSAIWGVSPWNARVRIAEVTRFSRMNGIDSEGHEFLIAAAPDLLAAVESEYAWLADIHHNWAGRDTVPGQQRLCRLRDLICKATGREPQDVQDDYGNRNTGEAP